MHEFVFYCLHVYNCCMSFINSLVIFHILKNTFDQLMKYNRIYIAADIVENKEITIGQFSDKSHRLLASQIPAVSQQKISTNTR